MGKKGNKSSSKKTNQNKTTKTGMRCRAVFDPDNAYGFVYSCHNEGTESPEFIALDVPRCKVPEVNNAMQVCPASFADQVTGTSLVLMVQMICGWY
jgi:hypothetical protein